ncbi:uncharacterized protein YcnI [Streptomyces sp. V4I23]|uniref:YcnI family copper-binding membrane protein n=1 Tax=Streptomyces sp. V4I23 TaxID=3042282 RepID=UPI00277F7E42|nr:YcnI family protein [Streptomyces sp. V4I23]MDQ1009076.1 uncharacterized protein YcnI [Streptomyces sp. V4I23]
MTSRIPRHLMGRCLSAATVAGAAVVLLAASGASAHVSVDPGTAEPGGFTKEAFRVPNERDDASTVQVEVAFPTDHPLGHVSVQPVPGWKATVKKEKLDKPVKDGDHELTEAVSSIVWKGGSIRPGEFQEFPVSFGPLPTDTDELVFKALQTYSDGEVVRWIDVPQEGGGEPERPAPVLELKAAAQEAPVTGAAAAREPRQEQDAGATPVARTGSATDTLARVLGGGALALGLVALGRAALRRPAAREGTSVDQPGQEKVSV